MTEIQKPILNPLFKLCTLGILLLLIGILISLFLGDLYALLFDRADLFFGIPVEGGVAGVYLFAKVAIELLLILLIINYPRYFHGFVKISIAFSGFLLGNSIVTTKITVTGFQLFSPVLGIFFLLSMGLFILHSFEPVGYQINK